MNGWDIQVTADWISYGDRRYVRGEHEEELLSARGALLAEMVKLKQVFREMEAELEIIDTWLHEPHKREDELEVSGMFVCFECGQQMKKKICGCSMRLVELVRCEYGD